MTMTNLMKSNVRHATDEAFEAYHKLHPELPQSLLELAPDVSDEEIDRLAEERLAWVNAYIKEHYPSLF